GTGLRVYRSVGFRGLGVAVRGGGTAFLFDNATGVSLVNSSATGSAQGIAALTGAAAVASYLNLTGLLSFGVSADAGSLLDLWNSMVEAAPAMGAYKAASATVFGTVRFYDSPADNASFIASGGTIEVYWSLHVL